MHLSLSLLLLFSGLALAAWRTKDGGKNPLLTLGGLALVLVALFTYLFSGLSLLAIVRSLFVDAGLALVALGGLLALRRNGRSGSASFVVLGLVMLGAGLLLSYGVRLAAGTAGPEAAQEAAGDAGATPEAEADDEETTFLLELGPDDRIEEVQPLLDRFAARAERAFPTVDAAADEDLAQYFVVYVKRKVRDALMELLGKDAENVDFVELNPEVGLVPAVEGEAAPSAERGFVANDPFIARQWGLQAIGGPAVHLLLRGTTPRRKAVVAILDTGVDARHEDLDGVFGTSPGTTDGNGHGTHCAGIAGAVTNNGRGVASLNWEGRFVEVVSYPALPHNGHGSIETIAQAVLDATQAGVDVISMSLGDVAPVTPRVMQEAVAFALAHNVIVVASAGNANRDAIDHMPSNIDGVIAVAAVDRDLKKARFSNTVTSLQRPLAAPGVDILSLKPDGAYVPMSGTSMATPMVAGLLGVLRALNPALTAADAYTLLHASGTTVEDTPLVGRVINAEAAVRAVGAGSLAGRESDYRVDVE